MKSKQVRISVEVLNRLGEKLIADGRAPAMVEEYLGVYVNEILWEFITGHRPKQSSGVGHVTIHAETDDAKRIRQERASSEEHPQKKRTA